MRYRDQAAAVIEEIDRKNPVLRRDQEWFIVWQAASGRTVPQIMDATGLPHSAIIKVLEVFEYDVRQVAVKGRAYHRDAFMSR